jgi:hypothetical protein
MKKQAGYTHYWELKNTDAATPFTPEEWKKVVNAAKKIIRKAEADDIAIRGPLGEGKPSLTPKKITLNGDAEKDEDFETFTLENKAKKFNFCKTGRRPYDVVVTSILAAAAAIQPNAIILDSDGGDSVFSPAKVYKVASVEAQELLRAAQELRVASLRSTGR